ncbi:ABC transporter permease [Sporanaerobacter acetigenes]|uniref:ABC-type transport system, involved in lipoprotein release, permease component n=1 Tax=Sporanaerobacter acetigenes DSM 13106 TaxID=1123281 RepID=A0A1M5T1M4_9FIRM|nr:ABC transporter permease [Sporanaerobacter acetigenes]SHH44627.1 ABC-type transport system, involved in lipoprotein release, permease component [Sporanaerobacter acetigenes DSM 13106]
MNSKDLVSMGIKNLWRRKLRTFLTVLGVVIGTSSIIVMLSLGFGMKEAFKQQISEMGSLNIITVSQGYRGYAEPNMNAAKKQEELNEKSLISFSKIEGVKAVTPIVETSGKIVDGKYSCYLSIRGVDPKNMEDFDYKLADGRLLKSSDDLAVVYGGEVKNMFYNENSSGYNYKEPKIDLMKDKLIFTFDMEYGSKRKGPQIPQENSKKPNYKTYKFKTVGVLAEGDYEKGYYAYMPIDQVKKLIQEKNKAEGNKISPEERKRQRGYQTILVKVDDINKVQEVQTQIKDMGYNAYSLSDYLESMKKTSNTIQAILGGIGAVSLLVAAIGITNTMVMSIYERTKEIGVMKVIGASLRDIKRLFLFESGMIGLLGGIIGVGLSELLSFVINKIAPSMGGDIVGPMGVTKISIIPVWLILAAMAFATFVGLLSGYYPAKRAMNLSALEAIKTE